MIYGYARVSSKGQERYGNSLQDQQAQLTNAGCTEIYCDSFTGTKMDRPQFSALMNKLQPGDTLTVTKLDRFARTAADGAKTVQGLIDRGIAVHVLNMGKADNTPMGKLLTTVMFAFAEFERDMIVERTATGRAVAKANNPDWREGRKAIDVDRETVQKFRQKQKGGKMTVAEICGELKISRATWYNKVREVEEG